MRRLLRGILRLLLVAAVIGIAVAAVRALMGRLSGEPGVDAPAGSFDSWPPVARAPGVESGDGAGARSGAGPGADAEPGTDTPPETS